VWDFMHLAPDASPAAQLFGALLFGVFLLRLFRYVLSFLGLGS
jgi:hypothetical protein